MAKEKHYPLDENGNIRFDPMHRFTVKRTGKQVMRLQMMIRVTAIIVLALFIFVLLMYLFSLISGGAGRFTVSSSDGERGLILCEHEDFVDYTAILEAEHVEEMDNTTYAWLPTDLTETDGSHNGDPKKGQHYLAYTFYVKNTGTEDIDYQAKIVIDWMKLAVDEAVRVQVYRNDETTVYAKQAKDGTPEVDPDWGETVPFTNSVTVCDFIRDDFVVNEIDKYTVVVWLEGHDPECVNDILGGELKMSMHFSVLDPEDGVSV